MPDLSWNLFSVRDITDKGNRMMFDDITCSVITRGDVVIASGHKRERVGTTDWQLDEALVAAQPSSDLWHQRLAHVKVLEKLVSCDVSGVDLKKVEPWSFCEGCVQGKASGRDLFYPKIGEGAFGCLWPNANSLQFQQEIYGDFCG